MLLDEVTHVLVFMVMGINYHIKVSIGHFPTRSSTADELYPMFWKAVAYLEITCGLKVNSFFSIHKHAVNYIHTFLLNVKCFSLMILHYSIKSYGFLL